LIFAINKPITYKKMKQVKSIRATFVQTNLIFEDVHRLPIKSRVIRQLFSL
jgi:hypothetical protein